MQHYVVGFAVDNRDRVALIQKNRPEWQAGRLNGIGGHVEANETADNAMQREFWEETGTAIGGWHRFVVMEFPEARIDFYRARIPDTTLDGLRTTTDEPVSLHRINDGIILARVGAAIPNLAWLLPLAAYTADHYDPIHVKAQMAEVLELPHTKESRT